MLLLIPIVHAPAAWSSDSSSVATKEITDDRRPVFDLRAGVDRLDQQHPFLCAEVSPLRGWSLEGCGTGSGFLHRDPDAPDMAHFRGRGRAASMSLGRATAEMLIGVGFAEIQRAADQPGFRFGAPDTDDPVEAAGPEASVSIKGRYPLDPKGWTYITADLNAGAAAIPGAPAVLGQQGPIVPFAAFTLGFGF